MELPVSLLLGRVAIPIRSDIRQGPLDHAARTAGHGVAAAHMRPMRPDRSRHGSQHQSRWRAPWAADGHLIHRWSESVDGMVENGAVGKNDRYYVGASAARWDPVRVVPLSSCAFSRRLRRALATYLEKLLQQETRAGGYAKSGAGLTAPSLTDT